MRARSVAPMMTAAEAETIRAIRGIEAGRGRLTPDRVALAAGLPRATVRGAIFRLVSFGALDADYLRIFPEHADAPPSAHRERERARKAANQRAYEARRRARAAAEPEEPDPEAGLPPPPSPAEIAAACDAIRAAWDDRRYSRA